MALKADIHVLGLGQIGLDDKKKHYASRIVHDVVIFKPNLTLSYDQQVLWPQNMFMWQLNYMFLLLP